MIRRRIWRRWWELKSFNNVRIGSDLECWWIHAIHKILVFMLILPRRSVETDWDQCWRWTQWNEWILLYNMERKRKGGMFGPFSNVWTLQTISISVDFYWDSTYRKCSDDFVGASGTFFFFDLAMDGTWCGTFTSRKRGANLNVE